MDDGGVNGGETVAMVAPPFVLGVDDFQGFGQCVHGSCAFLCFGGLTRQRVGAG